MLFSRIGSRICRVAVPVRWMAAASGSSPRVLVIGAQGALGSAVVSNFDSKGWHTITADVGDGKQISGDHLRFTPTTPWLEQMTALQAHLEGTAPLDAVVCTAGGWAGGGAGDAPEALVSSVENMLSVCLRPAVTAAHVACKHLSPSGVFVVVGSAAAVKPTPDMLGYGLAKAATHHLLLSVAPPSDKEGDAAGKRNPNRLPAGSRAYAVLPKVLDTPSNRKWISEGADLASWTPLAHVADKIFEWAAAGRGGTGTGAAKAVPAEPSGSLLIPDTRSGKTTWVLA